MGVRWKQTESNIHKLFDLNCENKLFTGLDDIFGTSSSIVCKFPLVAHNRWATGQLYLQTASIHRATEMEGEQPVCFDVKDISWQKFCQEGQEDLKGTFFSNCFSLSVWT